jgi:hypothetical protein
MNNDGFYKITLPLKENVFYELSSSIEFEATGKGRLGNHLVDKTNKGFPLVRTTTNYKCPAFTFSETHKMIVENIKGNVNDILPLSELDFNNALIEIYDRNYTKMKYHSDQCIDIDSESYIALFSCYEKSSELTEQSIRKLKIKNKETKEVSEVSLTHNSVILFSVSTNSKYLHKIVLEQVKGKTPIDIDNRWLGITFRKSETFIKFKENVPYFSNGEALKLADENQRKEFFKLRGEENKSRDFIYPELNYSLSEADSLPPRRAR